ncbi:MAG: ribosome assembly RNA-binding protein YhbY [Clostridia bacterium]|nr:ribosome assembly RNA-binding protein YhbY [Clostridia bacterium]
MLNSRQRAQLRGMANSLEPIFQIGKGGLNEQQNKQIGEALEARELIKLRVLESCPLTAREAADTVSKSVGADVVQVIGTKFILFRPCSEKENRKIVLVK